MGGQSPKPPWERYTSWGRPPCRATPGWGGGGGANPTDPLAEIHQADGGGGGWANPKTLKTPLVEMPQLGQTSQNPFTELPQMGGGGRGTNPQRPLLKFTLIWGEEPSQRSLTRVTSAEGGRGGGQTPTGPILYRTTLNRGDTHTNPHRPPLQSYPKWGEGGKTPTNTPPPCTTTPN